MSDPLINSRILLVTRNLPPLVGGMERLNWHIADELAKVAEVRVIGPEGSAKLAPAGVVVREAPLKPLWKFLIHARALARREARTWKPDIVLAGSGLTAPLVRAAARTCGAKTAVYVHGLDVAAKHPIYRALWLPAICRSDRVIANSRATAALCQGIGVDPTRIGIVHPGVDLSADAPLSSGEKRRDDTAAVEPLSPRERGRGEGTDSREIDSACVPEPSSGPSGHLLPEGEGKGLVGGSRHPLQEGGGKGFRACHNLADRPLLLSVGRLSARKGLREFVTQALPSIAATHPDVVLLVVGDAPNDALHAQAQTPDSIRAAAAQAGVTGNLRFLGRIPDTELDAIYRAADVHVFPVREIPGDPEGFGMVAVEAAAHGLPTVAFATGGVVDAVAEGQSGHLVASNDYAAFADAVLRMLAERDALRAGCSEFAQQFAWPRFGQQIVAQLAVLGLEPLVKDNPP